MLAAIDVTHGHGVVSRPGIIHADRKTEVIARLCRRMRRVYPDGGERSFIPDTRDAVGGICLGDNAEANYEKQDKLEFFHGCYLVGWILVCISAIIGDI